MRWYPIVTFWQVAADMTNAAAVPGGHGHNYGEFVLDGWAAVAPPDGWTADDTERIRRRAGEDRGRRRTRVLVRPKRIRQAQALALAAALVGWSGRSDHGSGRAFIRWPTRSSAPRWRVITRAPLGSAAARIVVGAATGAGRAAPVAFGVAASTALPRVRAAMAERDLPDPRPRWLLVRIPLGTVWSEEAAFRAALGTVATDAFGPAAAGCCSRWRSGCRTSPTPAAPVSR